MSPAYLGILEERRGAVERRILPKPLKVEFDWLRLTTPGAEVGLFRSSSAHIIYLVTFENFETFSIPRYCCTPTETPLAPLIPRYAKHEQLG